MIQWATSTQCTKRSVIAPPPKSQYQRQLPNWSGSNGRSDAEPRKRFQSSLDRSEEHTSELQSLRHLVCRLLLEKKKQTQTQRNHHQHHLQTDRAKQCVYHP